MISRKQKCVLVFYADAGAGHRSVATAICSALAEIAAKRISVTSAPVCEIIPREEAGMHAAGLPFCATPEWRTELHNPIAGCDNPVLKGVFDLYAPVTKHAPGVFTGAYYITNLEPMCRLIGNALYGQMYRHLSNIIRSKQPALIVCVNSLLTYPILRAMRHCNCSAPFFTVVTDLASVHRSWVVPEVDRCFVPTTEARDEIVALGMPAEKIWKSGLPVHPAYVARSDESSREDLKLSLGLHPELFTVLITGGGEGIGQINTISRDLARSGLPIQLIIVTGRNQSLYKSLIREREHFRIPHKIYGYTYNMPTLMRASNVLVTKAGSATIAEALTCGLPMILSSVIEGQESGNVDFVLRNRVGSLARTSEEVVEAVSNLLILGEPGRFEMAHRALRLGTPAACFEVAEQILEVLDTGKLGESTVVTI